MSVTVARFKKRRTTTLLAGIRADEAAFIAFPCACSRRSVASDESWMHSPGHEAGQTHPFVLPLRGQRRLKVLALADRGLRGFDSLLLPVELRHVNHTASTNKLILSAESSINPTISLPMADPTPTDQLVERVERLLLRYEELLRTNELLTQQVQALGAERDSLKSRLSAARARVDVLLERLPEADTKTSS